MRVENEGNWREWTREEKGTVNPIEWNWRRENKKKTRSWWMKNEKEFARIGQWVIWRRDEQYEYTLNVSTADHAHVYIEITPTLSVSISLFLSLYSSLTYSLCIDVMCAHDDGPTFLFYFSSLENIKLLEFVLLVVVIFSSSSSSISDNILNSLLYNLCSR